MSGLAGRNADFAEGAISSLMRRGLIEEVVDDRLAPTELGRLVVNALGLHPDDAPLFEVLDTDLRSSDPLAFARVVGRIAALDRPLVVDPYCRRPQLEYLVDPHLGEQGARERPAQRGRPRRPGRLRRVDPHRDTKLRLRVAPAEAIHDRHVINGDRVLQIGGTAHQIGGGTTVISEPVDLGEDVRRYYRHGVEAGRQLAVYRPDRASRERVA